MATIGHKKTAIRASQANLPPDAVGSQEWLDPHVVDVPETGAILVGELATEDKLGWLLTSPNNGDVLTSLGAGVKPVWAPVGAPALPITTLGDLIVGNAAGFGVRFPRGAPHEILAVAEDGNLDWITNNQVVTNGVWVWKAGQQAAPIGDTFIGVNNATPANATILFIAAMNADGLDATPLLKLIALGDDVYIQSKADPNRFLRYQAQGPGTFNGTTIEIPVTARVNQGSALVDLENVLVMVTFSGGDPPPPSIITVRGDLIVGDAAGAPVRLPRGTTGQLLVVQASGDLAWVAPNTTLPVTTVGDIIVGDAGGSAIRFPVGAAGTVLSAIATGGRLAWLPATPITAQGDLITGDVSGVPVRFPRGAAGQVLSTTGTGDLGWIDPPGAGGGGLDNPMTTVGDMIQGLAGGAPARLPIGTDGQVLTVLGGQPVWQPSPNPMMAVGDMIVGGNAGLAQRLPAGADDQVLTIVSGSPSWAVLPPSMANPMTTDGDIITGGVGGAPGRLGIGATNQVLTVIAGHPAWVAPSFTNPMTMAGDIIIGGTGGAPNRLGIGSDGMVMLVETGAPTWVTPPWMTNPMTTFSDLIVGGVGGTPTRLGFGDPGTVLTVNNSLGLQWLPPDPGSTSTGQYRWQTALISAPPISNGYVGINNATTPTTCVISVITDPGADATALLAKIQTGDLIYIQEKDNSANFWRFKATGASVIANNAATVPVAVTGTQGAAIANNQVITVTVQLGGGSGISNPMTSVGDMIKGGTNGVAERLAIGTTGQVLTVAGGVPTWQTAASGQNSERLPIGASTLPDGTTNNLPPEIIREKSSGATSGLGSPTRTYAAFDASADEVLNWAFQLPSNYGSGGTLRLRWKARTATSGNVVWKAGFAAVIDGTTDDDAVAFANADLSAASPTPATQGVVVETTITLTMTNAAPNRWASFQVGRRAVDANDTMTGDAILMGVRFEYTPG